MLLKIKSNINQYLLLETKMMISEFTNVHLRSISVQVYSITDVVP